MARSRAAWVQHRLGEDLQIGHRAYTVIRPGANEERTVGHNVIVSRGKAALTTRFSQPLTSAAMLFCEMLILPDKRFRA
jgi:hypothetical protein